MSGHSKWSTIKHKKGAADARRGKIFTKLIKEITVAARSGGGDVTANPRLRQAILAAKAENMPKDNMDRAIKKGTGELEGVSYEEILYEGYGPGGAAVMVESLTDNKNRTVAEVRHLFAKVGGNLGENGCVGFLFETKGYFSIAGSVVEEDRLMEMAIEAGAEDVRPDEGDFEVITAPRDFEAVKQTLEKAGLSFQEAAVTKLPKSTVTLQGKEAEQMVRLMENLEDSDDVQKVYTNADIPQEVMDNL